MSDEMKVIALKDLEGVLAPVQEKINKDLVTLKDQMDADRDANKLALDERADDQAKYKTAIEDISTRQDQLSADIKAAEQRSMMGETANDLRKSLEVIAHSNHKLVGDDEDSYSEVKASGKVSIKALVEGVVLENGKHYFPSHELVKEVQDSADDLMLIDAYMRAADPGGYQNRGGVRSLKVFQKYQRSIDTLQKADADLLDTTLLANWIPTAFSPLTWERIVVGLPEVSAFDEFTMTAPTVQLHNETSDDEADVVAEATLISELNPFADLAVQTLTDGKITFSAFKLRSRFVTTVEATEDSIVPLIPRMQRKMVRNMREALADGIINGQETAGIDSGGTHFGKANATLAATDVRGAMDGIRYFAQVPTTDYETDGSGAATSVALMRACRKAMGEPGQTPADLLWFMGIGGYMDLLADGKLETKEKSDNYTARSGAINIVDGVDIAISRRMPENCAATGLITGTGSFGVHVLVNTNAYLLGNRRRLTVGQDVYGATDGRDLWMIWRGDFQKMFPSTEHTEDILINVTS